MSTKAERKGRGRTRTIRVDALTRVEGEGALFVRLRGNEVADVQLRIYEPPRFFEAFLRGRRFDEAPDLTARICGICPVAYQMSACKAIENALGVEVDGELRDLRRLLYCGEWIQSHALHVYLLHAPDFLGQPSAIEMAREHREAVERGLRLKRAGNLLMETIGGRAVHPTNVRVGGFYKAPSAETLARLLPELGQARDDAEETVRWVAGLDIPEFEQDYEFVALREPEEYAILGGRLVSDRGLDIDVQEFDEHFVEEHLSHSNALHCRLRARGAHFVGPLARVNLNFDRLSPRAREAAARAGFEPPCRNPFRSIVARAIELVWACDEALHLIGRYTAPQRPHIELRPRASVGRGCTEAPRGILYHRYRIRETGEILDAAIVPPTSQNQPTIESDLRCLVAAKVRLPDDELRSRCEQAIRNYDPCISCATHFLRLRVERD